MLSCRDLSDQASALLDGDLPWRRRAALHLHLRMCSMCRAYLDQMRKTRDLLRRRPLAPPDRATEDALIARITAAAPDPARGNPAD